MKIQLNGQEKEFPHYQNLQQIVEQFCKQSSRVIAEVNGNIIKTPSWDKTVLKDGDAVELVNFVGGG